LLLFLFLRLSILNEIIVLDNRMRDVVRKKYHSDSVEVVRIGVSHELLRYPRERKEMQSPPVIFFHGILAPRRRVEDLLLAITRLRQPAVLRIGGSTHFDRKYYLFLLRLTRRLHLQDRTRFLDDLEDDALAQEYQNCDMFVFPCDGQTWGVAPLEAMVFQKPVIVSTGSGVSEALNDSMAILVPPRDPNKLAQSIQLLMDDKRLRQRLIEAGSAYVSSNLMFENTAKRLREIWYL
jgi:glycosyltransferase involved in cell wall biosynthesis